MTTSSPPKPPHTFARPERARQSATAADSHALDANLGFLMKQVYLSLNRLLDQDMAPLGLTAMQWRPITCLDKKRADTAAGLAKVIDVDTGAMTRTLDRLEAKGLVVRTRSHEDRRVVRIELTEAGQAIAHQIPARISRTLQHHLRGFDAEEVRLLTHFMQRMLANGSVLPPVDG